MLVKANDKEAKGKVLCLVPIAFTQDFVFWCLIGDIILALVTVKLCAPTGVR